MITNIITATVTAYCHCVLCCSEQNGVTANGLRPKQGVTIAASRQIPFNSSIIYQGHTYTVQDRLSKKYDSRFDIYFRSHKEALKFGIKHKQQVTIITP